MRPTRLLSVFALFTTTFSLAAACSSGGGDAPASAGEGLCGAISARAEKCSAAATECDQALVRDCGKLADVLNPTALAAATTCTNEASCETSAVSCIGTGARSATPTDAQRNIAAAFCERCAKAKGDACVSTFFGSDGAPSALGSLLLPFGDAVLADVVSKCIDGVPIACPAAFPACAQGVILARAKESLPVDTAQCLITAALTQPPDDAGADTMTPVDTGARVDSSPPVDSGKPPIDSGVDTGVDVGFDSGADTTPCGPDKGTNDAPERAKRVEDVGECDISSKKFGNALVSTTDDDWFLFTGSPTFGCQPDPYAHANAPSKLCVYAQCNGGTTILDGGCAKGTPATKTIGGATAQGCCDEADAPEPHFKLKCVGGKDSTSRVYIESTSAARACISYDIDYHF